MFQIPVTKTGNTNFEVSIEGITYLLQFNFNSRNQRLYMSYSRDGSVIIEGMRVLENGFLNFPYPAGAAGPPGTFYVGHLKGVDPFATLGNTGINEDFSVVYLSLENLER